MKEGERESAELWALPMGQETTVTVLPSCCCSGRAPPPEIPVNLPGRVGTSTLRLLDCASLCCCSRRRRSQSAPDAGKELRNLQRVPRRWGSALAGRNGDVTDVAGPCPAGGGFKREGGCSVLCCSGRTRGLFCALRQEKRSFSRPAVSGTSGCVCCWFLPGTRGRGGMGRELRAGGRGARRRRGRWGQRRRERAARRATGKQSRRG